MQLLLAQDHMPRKLGLAASEVAYVSLYCFVFLIILRRIMRDTSLPDKSSTTSAAGIQYNCHLPLLRYMDS